ncbi:hypothetical protein JYT26_01605 [Beggiatoa alba]|nr:hypothetical protein [Beggiatoa alba]
MWNMITRLPKSPAMRTGILSLLILWLAGLSFAASASDDDATDHSQKTLEKLLKVMPSASVVMLQMGERYKNLYWAAKLGQWEFAEYQTEEMEELIRTLIITRPARAKTANAFLHAVFPMISEAAADRDWPRFERAFGELRDQCMACHAKNDHAFVTLPIPKSANSPVLNMQ